MGKRSNFVLNTSSSPAGTHLPGFQHSIQVWGQALKCLLFLSKNPKLTDLIFSTYHIFLLAGSIEIQIYSLFLTTFYFKLTLKAYLFLNDEVGRLNAHFQSTPVSLNLHFLVEKSFVRKCHLSLVTIQTNKKLAKSNLMCVCALHRMISTYRMCWECFHSWRNRRLLLGNHLLQAQTDCMKRHRLRGFLTWTTLTWKLSKSERLCFNRPARS